MLDNVLLHREKGSLKEMENFRYDQYRKSFKGF